MKNTTSKIQHPVYDLHQGRRPEQVKRNTNIAMFTMLLLIALFTALVLSSCSTTKTALPFATTNRIGEYPVKKARPVRNNDTWIYHQYKHEGR